MKRTIVALFALFMVIGMVSAEDIEVGSIYDTGAPSLEYAESQIPWYQKIGNDRFTMIDGALCSSHADWERYYTVSNNGRICYTNNQYTGVAFQVFRTTNGWSKLGERQLSYGERGCFDVQGGNTYLAHAYFCADTTKECTNYVSVSSCEDPDPYTIRERTCTQNGQTSKERVTVDWYDPDALYTCETAPPTGGGDANGGNTENPSESPTTPSCEGDFVAVDFPENPAPGSSIDGVAKFRADSTGTCLLSASINPVNDAFNQITASSNVDTCGDPSPYYAEVFAEVQAGTFYDVTFRNVQVPDEEGLYAAQVAAFTGCVNQNGQTVDLIEDRISVGSMNGASDVQIGIWSVIGVLLIIGAIVLIVISTRRS